MPLHNSVESLQALCVKNIVRNLNPSAKWCQHIDRDKADPKNQQHILSRFDLIRNNQIFK